MEDPLKYIQHTKKSTCETIPAFFRFQSFLFEYPNETHLLNEINIGIIYYICLVVEIRNNLKCKCFKNSYINVGNTNTKTKYTRQY